MGKDDGAWIGLVVAGAIVLGALGLSGFFAKPKCPVCKSNLQGKPTFCPVCRTPLKWTGG